MILLFALCAFCLQRARLREMEETCARSIEEQVATRCSKRLSDIREQHTVDMLRLEKKKEELHMLVDQQVSMLLHAHDLVVYSHIMDDVWL